MRKQRLKYKKRNTDYAHRRALYVLGKLCSVCRHRPAVEVHHMAGRNAAARNEIANKYEDTRNWLAVCRQCHVLCDKETPAHTACAAKMLQGELDLEFLKALRPGKRFALDLTTLHEKCDQLRKGKNGHN